MDGLTCCLVPQIERVQNVTLWQNYQVLKKSMEKKNGHGDNEKQLFHGTRAASVDFINKHGFNRGYAGTHGNWPHNQ